VRDVAADRVMAVQRTLLFTSPRVNLLGQEQFGISFRRERAIACPGARQIAIFVKSVAVPAPAPGN